MAIEACSRIAARTDDQNPPIKICTFNPPLVGMVIESSKRLNPNLNWLPETNFVNLRNIALETVVTGGWTIPDKAQT